MSDTGETGNRCPHFGNVGGAVNVGAGGDVRFAGDKTTTTTTTIDLGFAAGDEQKQQFQSASRSIYAKRSKQ